MRVIIGQVRGGRVVLEDGGEPPPEGARVAVVIEDGDGWVVDEESCRELLEAMEECDRGEVVSAEEVFAALPPRK